MFEVCSTDPCWRISGRASPSDAVAEVRCREEASSPDRFQDAHRSASPTGFSGVFLARLDLQYPHPHQGIVRACPGGRSCATHRKLASRREASAVRRPG